MKKIVILILILTLITIPSAYATHFDTSEIRVGLKSNYERVSRIEVKNETLVLGYMDQNQWKEEEVFTSVSGFEFVPETGKFWVTDTYFNTYQEANYIVQDLINIGLPAYVGSVSLNMWKVYVGGEEAGGLDNLLAQIETKDGYTYSLVEDNQLRVKMKSDSINLILENSFSHPQFMTLDAQDIRVIDLGTRKYRGRIEIGRYKKEGLTAINIVSLEEYLYGVLPGEIPVSWPNEALKAQAVAARTYAVYYKNLAPKYPNEPYDVCDTVSSQVYQGYTIEDNRTNSAIDATRGKLVYYNNEVIPTYFFSSSGGHTENSENVWSGSVPYLKGVPDIYETEPTKKPWVTTLTSESIKETLNKYEMNINEVIDVEALEYTQGGRVMTLRIFDDNGQFIDVNKETMRVWFGLNSRKFILIKDTTTKVEEIQVLNNSNVKSSQKINNLYAMNGSGNVQKVSDIPEQFIVMSADNITNIPLIEGSKGQYVFAGQGYGHGVGMSQSGAKGMAQNGYTYDEILEYYYTGAQVR
jgi:stage II sporulation protein D